MNDKDFSIANHLEEALNRISETPDPRLRQVMAALTKHLYAFINEIAPTEGEWMQGLEFLTRIGQMCDDKRQEFILLSDVLGATMLVDHINHGQPKAQAGKQAAGTTDSSVLGPFYRDGAPELSRGQSIAKGTDGEPIIVRGTVKNAEGEPIADAVLDVWQTAPNGLYEVQDPEQADYNLRGIFRSDGDGSYEFRSVKPVSYSIPSDGPVGQLLGAMGRHTFRPAHIHFIVSAPGYKQVVTQLFTEGDEYLHSDVVYGVKPSLVVKYEPVDGGEQVVFDFVLSKSA